MQHIEEAGIHSGDSTSVLPPHSLPSSIVASIEEQTRQLALELGVVGLMNVQFAVKDDRVYVLEVNPARLAHGAVRLEGDGAPAREDCGQGDGRQDARRAWGSPTWSPRRMSR